MGDAGALHEYGQIGYVQNDLECSQGLRLQSRYVSVNEAHQADNRGSYCCDDDCLWWCEVDTS